jgi:hypothetical protein
MPTSVDTCLCGNTNVITLHDLKIHEDMLAWIPVTYAIRSSILWGDDCGICIMDA